MAIDVITGFNVKSRTPLDIKYGPYKSLVDALQQIPESERTLGLTFGVVDNETKDNDGVVISGNQTRYIFLNGITDNDAIPIEFDNYLNWNLLVNGSKQSGIGTKDNVNFKAGSNVSLTYISTDNTVEINSSYENTQLTDDEVLAAKLNGFTLPTSIEYLNSNISILEAFEKLEYRVKQNDLKVSDINHFPGYSTGNPLMDGVASPGTNKYVARADHRHPTDTTRQAHDLDLDAIANITGTSGFLKKASSNVWELDSNNYLISETDPIFIASPAYGITQLDINNWNTSFVNVDATDISNIKFTMANGSEKEFSFAHTHPEYMLLSGEIDGGFW